MTEIVLGRNLRQEGDVALDLGAIIAGRFLVQGNSGAGKTQLLRRLVEQAHPLVQCIVVDPDGQLATLKEAFPAFVVAGGEQLLKVGGRALARHVRQGRYHLILDLSDLERDEQLRLAADFFEGLVACGEQHWNAALVVIDEAQQMAPQRAPLKTDDELRRCSRAVVDLMARGRKRGLAGVLATQRLTNLAKSAASEATTVAVGRTMIDLDVKRSAELIGVTYGRAKFLRGLAPGNFAMVGPAVVGMPTGARVRVGPVSSRSARQIELAQPVALSAEDFAADLEDMAAMAAEADGAEPASRAKKPSSRAWEEGAVRILTKGVEAGKRPPEIATTIAVAGFRPRTVSAIAAMRNILGLKSPAQGGQGRAWEPGAIQILRDGYSAGWKRKTIAQTITDRGFQPRTIPAISVKACELGLAHRSRREPGALRASRVKRARKLPTAERIDA